MIPKGSIILDGDGEPLLIANVDLISGNIMNRSDISFVDGTPFPSDGSIPDKVVKIFSGKWLAEINYLPPFKGKLEDFI